MSTSPAQQPQSQQQQNPNAEMSLSAIGLADLIRREGIVRHYYNDGAHNCTYGVGSLLHLGPCTAEESHMSVTDKQIVTTMHQGIDIAERAILRQVRHQTLTQEQFDALVSFTYNVGATRAHPVLGLIDAGSFDAAASRMRLYIRATMRGRDGRPLLDKHGREITEIEPGLIIRRREESAPFAVHQDSSNAGSNSRGDHDH